MSRNTLIMLAAIALIFSSSQVLINATPCSIDDGSGSDDSCSDLLPICPYHYFCSCDFSCCLDSYVESAAEDMADQTEDITLCDIQQLFILVQNAFPDLDYDSEIDMVSAIVDGLLDEIDDGDYDPPASPPDYCDKFADSEYLFSPDSMFSSTNAQYLFDAEVCYLLDLTMPDLSDDFQKIIQDAIEDNTSSEDDSSCQGLYDEMTIALRSILSTMMSDSD